MGRNPTKAADFLKAMQAGEGDEPTAASATIPPLANEQPTPAPRATKAATPRRAELKHFGGYLDDDTLEKIALLRVRLKKDNSQLIKLAIEDLFRKHSAKRAFGDA